MSQTVDLTALTPEQQEAENDKNIKGMLDAAFSKDVRKKAEKIMETLDKKLGITPLVSPSDYDQTSMCEKVIHHMRWNQQYIFDCNIEELYQMEMALTAHILYVKSRENHWRTMVDMAKRELRRAVKLSASRLDGKTVMEREAMAMNRFPQLREMEEKLDVYNIYSSKCDGLTDVFTQMDNSLKKTMEFRRGERERHSHGSPEEAKTK
jgi:hypothetical protein